ncbi:hypothetical protein EK21DRAFT_95214 [Setomelanomma holmii]|uniref:Uncharacterized protein n=1 Tax=Setomelanomma holmii TaxID=210430 RepID=A0A9P4GWD9_9PLEO|nr:hypothetical protein EK21DRAFT_95214 [Setomelanomma holmii]
MRGINERFACRETSRCEPTRNVFSVPVYVGVGSIRRENNVEWIVGLLDTLAGAIGQDYLRVFEVFRVTFKKMPPTLTCGMEFFLEFQAFALLVKFGASRCRIPRACCFSDGCSKLVAITSHHPSATSNTMVRPRCSNGSEDEDEEEPLSEHATNKELLDTLRALGILGESVGDAIKKDALWSLYNNRRDGRNARAREASTERPGSEREENPSRSRPRRPNRSGRSSFHGVQPSSSRPERTRGDEEVPALRSQSRARSEVGRQSHRGSLEEARVTSQDQADLTGENSNIGDSLVRRVIAPRREVSLSSPSVRHPESPSSATTPSIAPTTLDFGQTPDILQAPRRNGLHQQNNALNRRRGWTEVPEPRNQDIFGAMTRQQGPGVERTLELLLTEATNGTKQTAESTKTTDDRRSEERGAPKKRKTRHDSDSEVEGNGKSTRRGKKAKSSKKGSRDEEDKSQDESESESEESD